MVLFVTLSKKLSTRAVLIFSLFKYRISFLYSGYSSDEETITQTEM